MTRTRGSQSELPSVVRGFGRGIALTAFGAVSGALCLVAAYIARSPVDFEMDRDLPSVAIGLYSVERAPGLTFAWTSERADFTLRGLDRTTPWTCVARIQAVRPDPSIPLPIVRLAIDGVDATERAATAGPMTVEARAPARAESGLRVTLMVAPTFVPGQGDQRRLGVILDRLSCRPERWPPWPPLRAAAAGAAAIGAVAAGLALLGVPTWYALVAVVLIAAAQAWAVTIGVGPYSAYAGSLGWLAAWIALPAAGAAACWTWLTGRPLDATGKMAIGAAAGIMYVKLLALLHPSKDLVDALFHAHRLDWVLAGQFYFTQLSTSATPFPYAIGLYVFAAPWAWLTRDHVTLLRVVVCAWEAAASLLVFTLVARAWRDRLAGLFALLLCGLVPLSYTILGNANLTSAFGTAVSVSAVACAGIWAGIGRRWPVFAGLTLVTALGFVSHISTLTLLLSTLVLVGLLYWWLGGPALRPAARTVLAATVGALVLAITLYWGHFGPVYLEQIQRARAAATAGPPASEGAGREEGGGGLSGLGTRTLPLGERIAAASAQTVQNLGWPLLALASVGLWRLRTAVPDRLGLLVVAWGLTFAGFIAAAVLGPGNAAYQQDAWEFIGRVEHATHPAAVILAAMAGAWLWRRGGLARLVSCILLLAAAATGAKAWASWLLTS